VVLFNALLDVPNEVAQRPAADDAQVFFVNESRLKMYCAFRWRIEQALRKRRLTPPRTVAA